MAKHPFGAAYELTREELQSPARIQQLQIDDSWLVRVGADWLPLPEFLRLRPDQMAQAAETGAAQPPSAAEHVGGGYFSANAKWTPAVVFSLALRLVGIYLLLQVFQGVVTMISQIATPTQFPLGHVRARIGVSFFIIHVCYVAAGFYLLLGPRAIVAFVFKDYDRDAQ